MKWLLSFFKHRNLARELDEALAIRKQIRLSGKVSVGAYVRRRAM